ncbi:MAG: DUF2849 domain-containing protein [Pseudomonadota bacterium]
MQVITANRLIDGEVVWLAAADQWVESVEAAETFADKTALSAGLGRAEAAVANRLVVDAYAIDVTAETGRLTPVRFRERIRAAGPTVRPDLGKQAATRPNAA